MPHIRVPGEFDVDEILQMGVMAALKCLNQAGRIGYEGMCPVCGAPDCSVLYCTSRGRDILRDQNLEVIVGCDKCLEAVEPYERCFNLALEAVDMARAEYERKYKQDDPDEDQPKEKGPKEGGRTKSIIDELAGEDNPPISNF